ncbi:hypothetical protein FAI40_04445 [Acetobacteraceae bacterium]|nr:hypothetical protein FAI40_04445 [Acetobacteraceae bacterium]
MIPDNILILPNYTKAFFLQVLLPSEQEAGWEIKSFQDVVPNLGMPEGTITGIGSGRAAHFQKEGSVLGRFYRIAGAEGYLIISVPTGKNAEGKFVYLTRVMKINLSQLGDGKATPVIPALTPKECEFITADHPDYLLTAEEKLQIEVGFNNLNGLSRLPPDPSCDAIGTMLGDVMLHHELQILSSVPSPARHKLKIEGEGGNNGRTILTFVCVGMLLLFIVIIFWQKHLTSPVTESPAGDNTKTQEQLQQEDTSDYAESPFSTSSQQEEAKAEEAQKAESVAETPAPASEPEEALEAEGNKNPENSSTVSEPEAVAESANAVEPKPDGNINQDENEDVSPDAQQPKPALIDGNTEQKLEETDEQAQVADEIKPAKPAKTKAEGKKSAPAEIVAETPVPLKQTPVNASGNMAEDEENSAVKDASASVLPSDSPNASQGDASDKDANDAQELASLAKADEEKAEKTAEKQPEGTQSEPAEVKKDQAQDSEQVAPADPLPEASSASATAKAQKSKVDAAVNKTVSAEKKEDLAQQGAIARNSNIHKDNQSTQSVNGAPIIEDDSNDDGDQDMMADPKNTQASANDSEEVILPAGPEADNSLPTSAPVQTADGSNTSKDNPFSQDYDTQGTSGAALADSSEIPTNPTEGDGTSVDPQAKPVPEANGASVPGDAAMKSGDVTKALPGSRMEARSTSKPTASQEKKEIEENTETF